MSPEIILTLSRKLELAKQIIQDHISSFGIAELFTLSVRENPTAFYGQISHLHQEMFMVLLALNRRYFPTYKWLYRVLDEMIIKPKNIDQRLRQAFVLLPVEAITETQKLLLETLALVENHFPSIDTARVRKQLEYTRTAHLKPVIF